MSSKNLSAGHVEQNIILSAKYICLAKDSLPPRLLELDPVGEG